MGVKHIGLTPDSEHLDLDQRREAGFLRDPEREDDGPPAEINPLLAGLRTGDFLNSVRFAPLRYIVPDLIPEGGLTLTIGKPKIGKSWLVLDIALAAAAGGYVLGRVRVEPRPVLLLALEDSDRRLQARGRVVLEGALFPANFTYITAVRPDQIVPTIEAWLATLPAGSNPLIVLDTLGKVMRPALNGESQYQRDYKVAGRLKQIADEYGPGATVIAVHHDRKAQAADFVDSISGTSGLAGAADTIAVLTRPRNETTGLLKITGRDVEEREYAVTTQGGRWALQGKSLEEATRAAQTVRASEGLGDRSAEIVRLVHAHPQGITPTEVSHALGDMTAPAAGVYLKRLVDAGKIDQRGRGRYLPHLSPVESERSVENTRDVATLSTYTQGGPACTVCGEPMAAIEPGQTTHPACDPGAPS